MTPETGEGGNRAIAAQTSAEGGVGRSEPGLLGKRASGDEDRSLTLSKAGTVVLPEAGMNARASRTDSS